MKIDRSFVARAPEQTFDSMVVGSNVRLAAALELDVVAEGVETFEQLQLVRAMGVDRAQGFLLAGPMPVEDTEKTIFGGSLFDVTDVETSAGGDEM